jgi:RNA methyltransferase, TrmH family
MYLFCSRGTLFLHELRKLRKNRKYKYIWADFIKILIMISKQEQKYVQSLHLKKYRKEYGVFLVEGEKGIAEVLASDFEIEKIYCTEKYHLIFKKINKNVNFIVDNEDNISKISNFVHNSVGVALVKQKVLSKNNSCSSKILILDGISDPGNLGTIIRLADWYGVNNVVCSEDCAEFYNPKVISATMGSFCRVIVNYVDLGEFLKAYTYPVLGAFLNGKNVHEVKKLDSFALVIGSESHGISEKVSPYVTSKITIPRRGKAESLNAGVACGILLDRLF